VKVAFYKLNSITISIFRTISNYKTTSENELLRM